MQADFALRDLDGDGTPEITVALYAEHLDHDAPVEVNLAFVMVPWLGVDDRAGSFAAYEPYGPEVVPVAIDPAEPSWWWRQGRDQAVRVDLDGDGAEDIVSVVRAYWESIGVLWQYGDGLGGHHLAWARRVDEHTGDSMEGATRRGSTSATSMVTAASTS